MVLKDEAPRKPKEGDIKVTRHFAFFPKQLTKEKIWLERYEKVYKWNTAKRYLFIGCPAPVEGYGDWDLIEERRIY